MFDINKSNNYQYNLYLCNMDKSLICALDYIDINYTQNFLQFDELQFTVSYDDNGWRTINNKSFNYLQPLYLILMEVCNNDEIIFKEYFIINDPSYSFDEGRTQKTIRCYDSSCEFNNRYLNSYTDVRKLYDFEHEYDFNDSTKGGILNYMLDIELSGTWKIKYISPTLLNVYHSFDFSSSTFRAVVESLQEQYNCYFIFDTVKNEISIYDAVTNEYGESTDIIISDENYLKSLSCDIKTSEMCTKLKVFGKNNISIAKYNPYGQIYILDYDWFQQNERMSTSLSQAYTAWKNLVKSKETTFQNYLNQIESINTSLNNAKNQLATLNEELTIIEDNMDAEKVNSNATTYEYSQLYSQYLSKKSAITSKQNQINSYNNQLTNINNNIIALNALLSIENNFTLAQRQELSRMTIETKLTLDSVDDEQKLYEYALNYMKIKSKPSIDIQLDIIDLFSISNDYITSKYNKIKVGNYIYIDCSSLGFNYETYRITQISHNKLDNSLTLTISNKDRLNSELNYLNRIFKASAEAAADLETKKPDYGQYIEDKNKLITKDDTITNPISFNDTEINRRGFLGTEIGGYGAIQLKGDRLVITNDNWATYHTLLSGNGLYLEKSDKSMRIVINPSYGFQIDRNVGTATNPIWDNSVYISDGYIVVTGKIEGSEIFGGTISGTEINNGNGTFRVTADGVLYATEANITGNITGSLITGSQITSNTQINVNTNLYVGNNIYIGLGNNILNKGIQFNSGVSIKTYDGFSGPFGLKIDAEILHLPYTVFDSYVIGLEDSGYATRDWVIENFAPL